MLNAVQQELTDNFQDIKVLYKLLGGDRVLTTHVQTRAYRAPEVILLEPTYHKPVDIWSCGVILGELFLKVARKG